MSILIGRKRECERLEKWAGLTFEQVCKDY